MTSNEHFKVTNEFEERIKGNYFYAVLFTVLNIIFWTLGILCLSI